MEELTLREIQLGELEILKQFKRICEEQNLQYYLFYGTLLGAVRHGGFIPWDDDVDVAMPRNDYEKFIAYCKENTENLKPLELLHYSTNSEYIYPIARLNDTRYTTVYKNVDDYGLGLFIDIYPFDGCGNSEEEAYNYLTSIHRSKLFIASAGTNHFEKSRKRGFINNLKKLLGYLWAHAVGANALISKLDSYVQSKTIDNCNYVACCVWTAEKNYYSKDILKEQTVAYFENESFFIPKYFDAVLKHDYGDYLKLPDEDDRIPHHEYQTYVRGES